MKKEDFTFVGVENALKNGLTTIISIATVVGLLLLVILMIALGWNYFKLLLETVERYIVVEKRFQMVSPPPLSFAARTGCREMSIMDNIPTADQ